MFIQILELGQVQSKRMHNKIKDYHSTPCTQETLKQSPSKQPQALPNRILSGLFTKEFLINVKNQLTKTKSPRNKQQTSYHQLTDVNHYKVQIQNLRRKLRQLTKENEELKQRLSQYTQNRGQQTNADKLQYQNTEASIYSHKLRITSEVSLFITGKQFRDEIQKLRQKVENLEMYKTIKQKRFEQLVQKSARYQSQILLLKVKQQDLQEEVKSLRETIKIQVIDMNGKPLRNTSISDNKSGKSLQKQNDIKLPFQKQEVNEMLRYMLNINKKYDDSLLMSYCRDVDVPDQMHISKMGLKTSYIKKESFNQIDFLIGEELPYLEVSQELKRNYHQNGKRFSHIIQNRPDLFSLQQSQLCIDLDSPCGKYVKNRELDQSLVKIQLDSNQIPEVPSIMESSEYQGNKLNQSIIDINLNDF